MSNVSAYYSGDISAARSAYRAHVRRGQVRPAAVPRGRVRRVDRAAYGHYDGDLEALLAALR